LAGQVVYDTQGRARHLSWRTLEEWYYQFRSKGFEGLVRKVRSDAGQTKALAPELAELVIALKQEDPGRSAPMILNQLRMAGRLEPAAVSVSTIQRHLRRRGLSGPKVEVMRRERFRFRAAGPNELWQADALHGPKILNPRSGQVETVKIFALIDDHSRLIVNLQAGFRETEAAFLAALHGAVARRGIPRTLYVDNGSSFSGRDLRLACAQVGIHLLHSAPYESSARGKIERLWRTLRAQVLERLEGAHVATLDDLNVRLMAWVEGDYNQRPHASLSAKTPWEVWEAGADGIRWVEDHGRLAAYFRGDVTRKVKNDATVTFDGVTYEVPGHLRRQSVVLWYSFLEPGRVWVIDGAAEVALQAVSPESNFHRRRHTMPLSEGRKPESTGLNPIEQLLERVSGRGHRSHGGDSR
jgi:transposase InsO family protein